jgi:hypothetical protein
MKKIMQIVNNPIFRASLAGLVGAMLLITGNILYSGIALGIGIREFFLAFIDIEE